MSREASGTRVPWSTVFRRQSRSRARRPTSRRPALVGDLCVRHRNDTRLSRRENRSNARPSRGRRDGERKRQRETERERGLRSCRMVGILSLRERRNNARTAASSPPPSSWRSSIMLRACHPRRWFCQPYRNRFPPVVYCSPALFDTISSRALNAIRRGAVIKNLDMVP